MLKYPFAAAVFCMSISSACADEITLINHSRNFIYRLYAWPTALQVRTFDVLGAPLAPDSKVQIDVDNSYGDCDFTFEYDPNDPRNSRKTHIYAKGLVIFQVNICSSKHIVTVGSDSPL